jgi:hypothetical protein
MAKAIVIDKIISCNNGIIHECLMADFLIKNNETLSYYEKTYYDNKKIQNTIKNDKKVSSLEIDFIREKDNMIELIEVKTYHGGTPSM